jgi:zinc protease
MRRLRRWFGLLACCLPACIAAPPAIAPSEESVHYPISTFTTSSGMRAVFEVAPDFGIAGAVLVVGAGAADEPPEKAGLAHLVEHLVFESRHGDATFRRRLESRGAGAYNGETSWDETTYYAFGPAQNLAPLLSVLADVLDDPLASIDEGTFEHARQVVLNEMHLRTEDGTPGQAVGLLASAVFPSQHPYARPVVGTEESIARLTLADARAFAAANYHPARSVLAVSSPLSLDAQKAVLETAEAGHTWPWKSGAPASHQRPAPLDPAANLSRDVVIRERTVTTPILWIGWAIPSRTAPEADPAEYVSRLVGSAFWRHVYDRDDDIASVQASVVPGAGASLFCIEAVLKKGRDARASADSLLRTMGRGFSEQTYSDVFDVIKRSVATDLVLAEEPIVTRTKRLAASVELTGAPTYYRSQPGRIVSLGSDVLARFYDRYLGADRAHVLLIRPGAQGGGDHDTGRRADASDRRDAKSQHHAGSAPVEDGSASPPPPLADVGAWMRPSGVSQAVRDTLPNGMEVIVVPRPGSPYHSVVVAYHGGLGNESVPGAGTAALWAKERLRRPGGPMWVRYSDRVGRDVTFELLRAPGSDLGLTLRQLRYENEFQVFWPPRQFTSQVEAFENEERSPEQVFSRRLTGALFGAHPYGRVPKAADVRAVRPKDVNAFLDVIRRPQNGVVVIVGDVSPSEAIKLVAAQSGTARNAGGPGSADAVATVPPMERAEMGAGGRLVVQERPGSANAKMEFLCVLPPVDADTTATEWLFSEATRWTFQEALRERTAASYAVQTSHESLRGGTSIVEVTADVDYAHLPVAIGAVRAFVDRPAAALFEGDRLAQARAAAARHFNFAHATTEDLAMHVVAAWNVGLPIDMLDRYPERVAASTSSDLARVAKHCQESFIIGFLGDETRIRTALAGWAP